MHTYISTSSTRWTGIHYISLQSENGLDYRLQFGMEVPTFTPLDNNKNTIISRGISTVPLTLNFPPMSTTTATDPMTTTEISTTVTTNARFDIQYMAITETINTEEVDTRSGAMATTEMSTTTTNAEDLEDDILEHIRKTLTFKLW